VSAPRVYLSGAIEHAADGGTGWRREIGSFLANALQHRVYDPAADEKKDLSEEEQRDFRIWKHDDPQRFRQVVRKIIAWDLDRIERETDYVVAFWDEASARGGGTAAEITLAYRLGKPVYLVLGMPAAEASGWILAAAEEVFEDFEGLKDYLEEKFGQLSPPSPSGRGSG
jgi:nucleoside 2-deoxyribosyltransferase